MTNWYKPRYKMSYILQNKIWSYQRSRLRGMYDKRGSVLFRRGYIHRQKRVLKNLKWIRIRRRFGFSNIKKFSWRIRRRKNRFLHVKKQYKINLQQKKAVLSYYGKIDQNNLKKIYKNYFLKTKNFKLLSLIKNLELRLHVILYKLKIFPTIYSSHQYISHKGMLVNNILSKQPSKILNIGDILKFPKKYWLIINYYLYNKFYGRIHREVLNWARSWYKLYWYKRLINSVVLDQFFMFNNKVNYLNNSNSLNNLWKINKWNIKLGHNTNLIQYNKIKKNDFFDLKKNWIKLNIKIKKKKNKLNKKSNKIKILNNKSMSSAIIYKKYNNKLLQNNLKFFIKNNLKRNILWTRNFSFFWILYKFIKINKNKFNLLNSKISLSIINKNIRYIYNTKSMSLINKYNVNNLNINLLNIKKKKLITILNTDIVTKIYYLKLLKKIEKSYICLYTWMLKYSNNKYIVLKNFLIVYKFINIKLNNIYMNIYYIQKLYNLIKNIKIILFNNIISNKNKFKIRKLIYKLLSLQYKLKNKLYKLNIILYNNNDILNKEYISILLKYLKYIFGMTNYIFKEKFYNESQFFLLNDISNNYIKEEKHEERAGLKGLELRTEEYIKNVRFNVLLNYQKPPEVKYDANGKIIDDFLDVILEKINFLYSRGYGIQQIKIYIKDKLYYFVYNKIVENYPLLDKKFYRDVSSELNIDENSNDVLDNKIFLKKIEFINIKANSNNIILNTLENFNVFNLNKKRKFRIKKYIIFYNYLYKIKLKNKKRLKRIYKDFFIKKNMRSVVMSLMNIKYTDPGFNIKKQIFPISRRIHPLLLNRVNILYNIYNKIRLLNVHLYDLSYYDDIFKKRVNKFFYRFNKKYKKRNKLINLNNINRKFFRLHFLLKKRLKKYKRYNSKFKGFFIQQFWYIPKYIEMDLLSYRLIIISEPYTFDVINSLGDYKLIRSVLGFFSRYGF